MEQENETLMADEIQIPDGWPSEFDPLVFPYLVKVCHDKRTIKFVGKGNHPNDHGSVRTNHPIPDDASIYYFEIKIIEAGHRGEITIGLSPENFILSKQTGSCTSSYGYKGNDGRKFNGRDARGSIYGPTFSTEDIVGCGVNFYTRKIFFTKEGKIVGAAFDLPSNAIGKLYPTVSLHSPAEEIEVNFGQYPFSFDIEKLRKDEKERVEGLVNKTEIQKDVFIPLLRSYFLHYGFPDTLEALERASTMPCLKTNKTNGISKRTNKNTNKEKKENGKVNTFPQNIDNDAEKKRASIVERKQIREEILSGDIESIISLLEEKYPQILKKKRRFNF